MSLPAGIRKHPVLTIIALALIAAVLWVTWFISSFDLNHYRQEIQTELSTRLAMPVSLGQAHLGLRDTGIAVSFSAVVIGDSSSRLAIDTDELWLLLEWSGLLQRELRFSRIGLSHPLVRLDLKLPPFSDDRSQPENPAAVPALALIQTIKVQTLEISAGQFELNLSTQDNQPKQFLISDVNGRIETIGLNQLAHIELSALLQQDQAPASVSLDGNIALSDDMSAWPAPATNVNLDIAQLDGTSVTEISAWLVPGLSARGRADLSLSVAGSANGGLGLKTHLVSQTFELIPAGTSRAITIGSARISGMLHQDDDLYTLKNMTVNLDGAHLAGEARLRSDQTPRSLEITLAEGSIPFKLLDRLAPATRLAALRGEDGGLLQLEQGDMTLRLGRDQTAEPRFEISQLKVSGRDLAWQITPSLKAELSSFSLNGSDRVWLLQAGSGQLADRSLAFSGTIQLPPDRSPVIDLQLAGSADAGDLLAMLPSAQAEALTLSGSFPFRAKLTGPMERVELEFEADIEALEAEYTDLVRLPPQKGSRATLSGTLKDDHFSIEHADLLYPPYTGQLSGEINWTQTPTLQAVGFLRVSSLSDICCLLPWLEQLQLNGAANLEFNLNGPLDDLNRRATLTLRDAGFSSHGIMADVSQMQGEVHITPDGLSSEQILARIGESPVSFTVEMKDFADPSALLEIQVPRIRANELIFFSDQTYLRDLSARLIINRSGIEFSPAQVGLPNGTQVRVNGTVTVRPQLEARLDITAPFADLEEVISLWTRQSAEARKQRKIKRLARTGKARDYRIDVQAKVDRGDLYGMQFQQAAGLISLRPNQLHIHPLNFRVDGGDCNAQALVDFNETGPLLRISGHAQEIDAYQIYNELLGQESILRGGLNGDFYLQGILGRDYLSSTYGSFDLTVKDGVLRRFHVLSKIFSLLNVAQLFSLQLPDMDTEGMPFNKISGSLLMDKGVLSSERLLLESEAMNQSYVGQIDLVAKQADFTLAIQPLGTVDKILTRIPIAGWLLTGEEKALITTHFGVKGDLQKPDVVPLAATSISEKTLGLIRRTLGLPAKLVTDPSALLGIDREEE